MKRGNEREGDEIRGDKMKGREMRWEDMNSGEDTRLKRGMTIDGRGDEVRPGGDLKMVESR